MLSLKPIEESQGRLDVRAYAFHPIHFHCALRVYHPSTRIRVRLLGPCYKTGRMGPCCQHLQHPVRSPHAHEGCGTHNFVVRNRHLRAREGRRSGTRPSVAVSVSAEAKHASVPSTPRPFSRDAN